MKMKNPIIKSRINKNNKVIKIKRIQIKRSHFPQKKEKILLILVLKLTIKIKNKKIK